MCALFGFLDYGKKIYGRTKKKLIQALSIACEARETDACGISNVKSIDLQTQICITKATKLPLSRFA